LPVTRIHKLLICSFLAAQTDGPPPHPDLRTSESNTVATVTAFAEIYSQYSMRDTTMMTTVET
jgi:hypothetical protein